MPTHTQRKRFDNEFEAVETANGFHLPEFELPGVVYQTDVRDEGDGFWLYLTMTGDLVPEDFPILPDYEKVEL